ncbi:sigma-70 family RNA polymerase sigma factor [Streptomyces decoyicus]|uniref:sigma-70 family RNA polymerase sigma factor n=1 Tax=Streptomyces decoyicus TaxID=249567 RepID=UPI003868281C|nr:sigma-70 family RNA polymerase sigma factor [Streptomyces decoyicus]
MDPAAVEHPRAYLVRVVTRQALNHLRAVRARREEYVGTWLPEPIRTAPEVSDDAILAESVSMAMMLVLETMNPAERAVFVLHDVFGYSHGEIAASIGKAEATVRQIAHRHADTFRRGVAAMETMTVERAIDAPIDEAHHDDPLHALAPGAALPPDPARGGRALRRRRGAQPPLADRLAPRTHHPRRPAVRHRVRRRPQSAAVPARTRPHDVHRDRRRHPGELDHAPKCAPRWSVPSSPGTSYGR